MELAAWEKTDREQAQALPGPASVMSETALREQEALQLLWLRGQWVARLDSTVRIQAGWALRAHPCFQHLPPTAASGENEAGEQVAAASEARRGQQGQQREPRQQVLQPQPKVREQPSEGLPSLPEQPHLG